jgi:hypothetical protein
MMNDIWLVILCALVVMFVPAGLLLYDWRDRRAEGRREHRS